MITRTHIKFGITTALAATYVGMRGFGGVANDASFAYNLAPAFDANKADKAASDAEFAIVNAAASSKAISDVAANPNLLNGANAVYQVGRLGYENSANLLTWAGKTVTGINYVLGNLLTTIDDTAAYYVTGHKIAPVLAPAADKVADFAGQALFVVKEYGNFGVQKVSTAVKLVDDTAHQYFSDETINLAIKAGHIGLSASLSFATHSPAPLYLAIADSGIGKDTIPCYSGVMSVVSLLSTFSLPSKFWQAAQLAQVGVKYFTDPTSTLRYSMPIIKTTADAAALSGTWGTVLNGAKLAKSAAVLNFGANFVQSVADSANVFDRKGSDWLQKRLSNSEELTYAPLATAIFVLLGGESFIKKLGDNPTAKSFIRDIIKAIPVIGLYLKGAEYGNTGIKYTLANVAAAFAKPICKLGVIGAGYTLTTPAVQEAPEVEKARVELIARTANYVCEPVSMTLNLASKGQQEQKYKFALDDSDKISINLKEGNLFYVVKDKEPIEIKDLTAKLSDKIKDSIVKQQPNVELSYGEAMQIWNFAAKNNYPSSEISTLEYFKQNYSDLLIRGVVVGLLKTLTSDQIGELLKGVTKFMDTSMDGFERTYIKPDPADPESIIKFLKIAFSDKIVHPELVFWKEVIVSIMLATPTKVSVEAIDQLSKLTLAHFSSPDLVKTDITKDMSNLADYVAHDLTIKNVGGYAAHKMHEQVQNVGDYISHNVAKKVQSFGEYVSRNVANKVQNFGEYVSHNMTQNVQNLGDYVSHNMTEDIQNVGDVFMTYLASIKASAAHPLDNNPDAEAAGVIPAVQQEL